jgi:CheY-like chemotaxis protein
MTHAAAQEEGKTILLVEDEADAREVLSTMLEDAGYHVLRAANGVMALEALRSAGGKCSLILLDLMMPVMNGWDFRKRQKDDPGLSHIPVLLMSAGARMASVSGEIDAAGFVTKPVDPDDMLEKVRRHCL